MLKCSQGDVTIRTSRREDMEQVFNLIKELADFEKLGEQVKLTAKVLEKDGFDSTNPAFECLVAEIPDGHIIGYALFYYCYSTWVGKSIFLEDIYLKPAYRGNGIGKQLFLAVAKKAQELGGRLDFHVLSWNPATEFYKSLGAISLTNSEEWELFRIDVDKLNTIFA